MDYLKSLDAANARLKPLKISIQQLSNRLYLQATLPPKPSGEMLTDMEKATLKWKQQKITTGLKANVEGVRLAEAKALEISSLLRQNAFDWAPYYNAPVVEVAKPLTVAEIQHFAQLTGTVATVGKVISQFQTRA